MIIVIIIKKEEIILRRGVPDDSQLIKVKKMPIIEIHQEGLYIQSQNSFFRDSWS